MGLSRNSLFTNNKWIWILFWSIAIASIWFFLWLMPWQVKLHGSVWLRLGIALAVFMVPGVSLYVLMTDRDPRWINHIIFGFVLSHLLIAFSVTMGRVFHFSFDLIKNFIMLLGGVLLVGAIHKFSRGFSPQFNWATLKKEASIWILGLVSVLVILIVIQRELSDDDLSYLAFLTNTQYSTHLNFNDVFFGLPQPVTSRFWLMSAPFAQALLAELGRVPGILILSGYYEPFLVIMSVLCWYELAIALKLSSRAASASVILQLTFLLLLSEYLHPGAPYFSQLSADKATAAFIFAPVFFLSLIRLLEDSKRNNLFLFMLTGLSLSFMHPIILAYSVFIGGVLIVLRKNSQSFRSKLIPIIVLIVIMVPQMTFRFVGVTSAQPVSYNSPETSLIQSGSDNLVSRWGDTMYYGFNPNILSIKIPYEANVPQFAQTVKWGWLLIPIVAVIFALKQWNGASAQFILACFILCFLAGFPFTGWIIGYFLDPRMLARSVWLFPFGLSAIFLLVNMQDAMLSGNYIWIQKLNTRINFPKFGLIVIAVFFSTTAFLFLREQHLPDLAKFERQARRYQDIAEVGQYLDKQLSTQAIVIGSEALNDLMPGVSEQARLVVFRIAEPSNMLYYTPEEIKQRISDRQTIFSESAPPELKLELLRKYNVRFIVLQRVDHDLFSSLVSNYPSIMRMEKVNRYFVLEIKEE